MSKGKEVALLILGGIGWLLYSIALVLGGALQDDVGSWLCVVGLALGIGMVYFGVDKLMTPRKRW